MIPIRLALADEPKGGIHGRINSLTMHFESTTYILQVPTDDYTWTIRYTAVVHAAMSSAQYTAVKYHKVHVCFRFPETRL